MTIITTPEQLKFYKIEAMESNMTLQKWVLRELDKAAVRSKSERQADVAKEEAALEANRAALAAQVAANPNAPVTLPPLWKNAQATDTGRPKNIFNFRAEEE